MRKSYVTRIANDAKDLLPTSQQPINQLANIIFLHELGHHILDPKVKLLDPYISEGFANFFAYSAVSSDYARKAIEKMAMTMEPKYNYFYLLPYMQGLSEIFHLCRQGNFEEASSMFRQRAEPCIGGTAFESSDSIFTIHGSVGGFLGFGCKRNHFLIGGKTNAIANIWGSIVVSGHVGIVLGFIDPLNLVIANSYNLLPRYPELNEQSEQPIHSVDKSIWKIPKDLYDIHENINTGLEGVFSELGNLLDISI